MFLSLAMWTTCYSFPTPQIFIEAAMNLFIDSHALKFREWLCCGCDSECLIILRQDFGEGCYDLKT